MDISIKNLTQIGIEAELGSPCSDCYAEYLAQQI